jgi:hypothetical protein
MKQKLFLLLISIGVVFIIGCPNTPTPAPPVEVEETEDEEVPPAPTTGVLRINNNTLVDIIVTIDGVTVGTLLSYHYTYIDLTIGSHSISGVSTDGLWFWTTYYFTMTSAGYTWTYLP